MVARSVWQVDAGRRRRVLVHRPGRRRRPPEVRTAVDDGWSDESSSWWRRHRPVGRHRHHLSVAKFNVIVATDGTCRLSMVTVGSARSRAARRQVPQIDGLEVCRKIHASSTQSHHTDRVRAAATSLQGFVTGPTTASQALVEQLALRIRAGLLPRNSGKPGDRNHAFLKVGQFTIDLEDPSRSVVTTTRQLTPLRFRIFHVLAINEGRECGAFSRWSSTAETTSGGLTSHAENPHRSSARKKLRCVPPGHGWLHPGTPRCWLRHGWKLGHSRRAAPAATPELAGSTARNGAQWVFSNQFRLPSGKKSRYHRWKPWQPQIAEGARPGTYRDHRAQDPGLRGSRSPPRHWRR